MDGEWVERAEVHGELPDTVHNERAVPTVEDRRLAIYLTEIINQAGTFVIAVETLEIATNKPDNARIFASIQSMLTAAASISRLFHPPRLKPLHKRRAELLAAAMPNAASDQVLKSREVRNAFEHFEEHLDEYLEGATGNIVIDRMVTDAPVEDLVRIGNGPLPKVLRAYRVDSLNVTVLDWSIDLQSLLDAVLSAANEAHIVMERRLGLHSSWRPPTDASGQSTV